MVYLGAGVPEGERDTDKPWAVQSSGAALYPNAALIDYGASKAAMVAMGKALARKYGADNVL